MIKLSTQNAVNTTLSGQSGTGSFAGTTAPTFTTSIAFTPTTGGVIGTASADNASTGIVGEFVIGTNSSGTALTSGVAVNVTSISLTAGDWDLWGNTLLSVGSTTTISIAVCQITTTSATIGTDYLRGSMTLPVAAGATELSIPTPTVRITIGTTTTVYLVASANFAVSTLSVFGYINARRSR